jgi:hypothetical protein
MQISSENPVSGSPLVPGLRENIFAFGDVCLTSLNEPKTVASIKLLSEFIVANLKSLALGRGLVKQLPSSITSLTMISLGPDQGILSINGMITHGKGIGKNKFRYTEVSKKLYNGDLRTSYIID